MAQRSTVIFGDQIDVSTAGLGLKKDSDDNFEVVVDDASIEIVDLGSGIGFGLQLKDGGVTESKLDIFNAPVDGNVLTWNNTQQQFEWIDVDVEGVQNGDLIYNEVPTGTVDSINTVFTIASTPVSSDKVRVYLNGMRQREGGSYDYTISASTITFNKAPKTGSDILVDYLIA